MSGSEGPALVVQGGALDGRAMAVRGPLGERLIGSGTTAHFALDAPNVEAEHVRLRWNDLGVLIEDLSRGHGTFLNGERVQQAMEVGHGDRISLGPPGDPGSVKLLVHLPGPPSDYLAEDVFEPAPGQAVAPTDAPATGPGDDAVAAAASGQWGAVDDDEEVIPAVTGAKPQPAKPGSPAGSGSAAAPASKLPPLKPPSGKAAPAKVAPRKAVARAAPRRERQSLSRALMIGVGAVLLCGAAYLAYTRALAPAPVLDALLPPKAEPGQTIQINGSGFGGTPDRNVVTFEDKPAQVIAATATQLSVVVPQGLRADDKSQHRVRVEVRAKGSNTLFFRLYVAPKVTAFEPDVAMPGEIVKAVGENFGDDTTVLVGGKAAEVVEIQAQSLRFKVPELAVAQGKALPVGVQVGKNAARLATMLIGKLPLLLEIAPTRAQPGDRVAIKGRGFDPAVGGTAVLFGERAALVVGASQSELSVIVPGGGLARSREVAVSVRAFGSTSSGHLPFTLQRASASVFLPRFFAEPGPDLDTVVVASDLGPFLRLRGKADAASVAERAERAAAALNAAIDQASRGAVAVETRDKPEPAVALAGSDQPILVATAADGQAYDGRPAARTLARFWAALLQDYLALFAQRERPFRVLELSPRGQALLELYAAAERRAGVGAGVPVSLIETLPPPQLRALSEMAMLVPVQAPTAAGAAVAGRWSGTLEETGRAARAIQVRLRTAGTDLQGSLTTRAGTLSAELPLQEASYRDGTLSFSVTLGAGALRFSGKVAGRSVVGQVQTKEGKPAGSFSLKWVE